MGRRKETKLPKGISIHSGMIRITISYQGRQRRKGTGLTPTKDNITLMDALLTQMRAQKALGTFEIEDYFPSKASKELKHFTSTPLGELVQEECDRKLSIGSWGIATHGRRIGVLNKHFWPAFGMLTLLELKPAHVRAWLKEQSFSSAYAGSILGLMRFIYTAAVGDGIVDRHPFNHIKPRDYLKTSTTGERKQRIDPLSFEEVERVINAAPDREKAIWGVGFYTGMRLQELLALKWEDIDFNSDTIHIQRAVKRTVSGEEYIGETKTNNSNRIIEVDAEVMRHLRYHRQFTQLEGTFVFKPDLSIKHAMRTHLPGATGYRHKALTRKFRSLGLDRYSFSQINSLWLKGLKRANVSISNRTPKQIRHTYASLMLSEGMNPMQVATCMGHTSLTMLERHYAKAIAQGKKNRRSLDISSMRKNII